MSGRVSTRASADLNTDQSRAVLSREPVRMRVPSGEKATARTEPVCPTNVATTSPPAASHSRAVLSSEPVRMRTPSRENATALTTLVCPVRVAAAFR